jgi:hypothetical protein
MPYSAEISRSSPTAFVFLVDQSGSMQDKFSSTGKSKADQVADVLNRTLSNLITRCAKSEGTRNYFEIGVIGYGGQGAYNGFQGAIAQSALSPIAVIESSPLRIEQRKRKMDDGAGGIIEQSVNFPVWFEPKASGGTPMCQGITHTAEALAVWCDSHPNSYPPTVLHITDGESTDGDPEQLATQLRQLRTDDGTLLMFNLHVSTSGATPIEFPASDTGLPDSYAKLLFRMSSVLPDHLIRFAQEKGHTVGMESRGFMFNADAVQLVDFFDIGTRAAQLR